MFFQMRTFVHVLDNAKQDWQAVAAILKNSCETIKKQLPEINEITIRSDNAGCYKNACLIGSMNAISKLSGQFSYMISE